MLRSPNLVDFIFYLKYMFQVSNSGFYTKNISAFLDVHLKPIAAKISSYIKDTNDFLRKLQSLPKLPDDVILCMIDVVGLYPNIPNEKGVIP